MIIGGFAICTIILISNESNWGYYLSGKTVLIIATSILTFLIGDIMGRTIILFNNYRSELECNSFKEKRNTYKIVCFNIKKNKALVLISILYSLIAFMLQIKYFYNISLLVGNKDGISGMFNYGAAIRSYVTHISVDRSNLEDLIVKLILPLSYVSFYLFISNIVSGKKIRANFILLITPIIHLLCELLSTNRIGIIYILIYMTVCTIVVYSIKQKWSIRNNKKLIKILMLSCIVVFIFFRISGYITHRGIGVTLMSQISEYTAGSLVALDYGLNGKAGIITTASNLFGGILRVTNKLGFTNASFMSSNAEFVFWRNGSTNIYTAIYAYVCSFGYIGNYLVFLLMGMVFGRLFKKIMYYNHDPFVVITFSWFIFAPTLSCIADRFLTQILVINVVIQLIFLKLLLKFLKKKFDWI
jgi:oligosaccharide repeat unit polymerase